MFIDLLENRVQSLVFIILCRKNLLLTHQISNFLKNWNLPWTSKSTSLYFGWWCYLDSWKFGMQLSLWLMVSCSQSFTFKLEMIWLLFWKFGSSYWSLILCLWSWDWSWNDALPPNICFPRNLEMTLDQNPLQPGDLETWDRICIFSLQIWKPFSLCWSKTKRDRIIAAVTWS